MNLRQFFVILRLRWWLVLLVFATVLGLAVGSTYVLPKRYKAETTLIIDLRTDPLLATFAPSFASPVHVATQVEIIKNDVVANRAVKLLGLAQSPEAVAQWREESQGKVPLESYFGAFLQKGLTVEPARGSNVLNLSFTNSNAAFAAAAANAYAKAFLEVSVDLRKGPADQTSTFYDEQAKTLRAQLEAAQAKLVEFERSKGMVANGERVDIELDKLNALTSQLSVAQVEFADANSRRANSGTESSVEVQSSSVVQGLKSELARVETKLSEVSSVVGSSHPTRIALEAQMAQLRQQISQEMRRVSGTTASVSRISGQKIAELRALVDAQKKLVLSLRAERDEAGLLRRDMETAQKAYEAVTARRGQLSLETQANQAGARVLSPAVEPIEPAWPNLQKNLLAGLLLGTLLGLAAAIGVEVWDRRVRSPSDLTVIEGIPLLAVISSKPGKFEPARMPPALPMSKRPSLTMEGSAA